MKRNALVVAGLLVFALSLAPRASADTYSSCNSDHPLRYLAYALNPVGVAVEYIVLRPFHTLISRDPGPAIFGHEVTPQDKFPGWKDRKIVRNEAAYASLCPFHSKRSDKKGSCSACPSMAQPDKAAKK